MAQPGPARSRITWLLCDGDTGQLPTQRLSSHMTGFSNAQRSPKPIAESVSQQGLRALSPCTAFIRSLVAILATSIGTDIGKMGSQMRIHPSPSQGRQ